MTGWIWSGLEMVRRANRPSLENLGGVWVCCSTFWAISALATWSSFVKAMSWGRLAVTMACQAIPTGHSAVLRALQKVSYAGDVWGSTSVEEGDCF